MAKSAGVPWKGPNSVPGTGSVKSVRPGSQMIRGPKEPEARSSVKKPSPSKPKLIGPKPAGGKATSEKY